MSHGPAATPQPLQTWPCHGWKRSEHLVLKESTWGWDKLGRGTRRDREGQGLGRAASSWSPVGLGQEALPAPGSLGEARRGRTGSWGGGTIPITPLFPAMEPPPHLLEDEHWGQVMGGHKSRRAGEGVRHGGVGGHSKTPPWGAEKQPRAPQGPPEWKGGGANSHRWGKGSWNPQHWGGSASYRGG